MAYYNAQRGRWIAQVIQKGERVTSSHRSKAAAERWEEEQKDRQNQAATLYEWAVAYLDHAKARHAEKTYLEKRLAFQQLFKSVEPHLDAALLHRGQVLAHFEQQAQSRSGNAANKDRKNLMAAWNWAAQYMPSFPQENPFRVMRCAEERSPRYVPPEQHFWAVYHVAESDQDRLMLLCYLHLAARRNEIFYLRREDVDLDRRKVRLHTRKRKDGSQQFDWLPMTEALHEAFQAHLAAFPANGFSLIRRAAFLTCIVTGGCSTCAAKPVFRGLTFIRSGTFRPAYWLTSRCRCLKCRLCSGTPI